MPKTTASPSVTHVVIRNGRIASLHESHGSAERQAGQTGLVAYPNREHPLKVGDEVEIDTASMVLPSL